MWSPSEADRSVVAWMLSPLSIEQFAEQYYEKAPLHIARDDAGFYNRYFSLADLENVLFGNELRTKDVKVVKDGTPARPESYVWEKSKKKSAEKEPASEIIDADRLSALFSSGCSVVLDHLQHFSTKVAELKRSMEQCFRHSVNGNLYLTPPGNQGFAVHYDTHDTWIIQIEGRKQWRVYAPPFALPLDDQKYDKKVHPVGEVLLEMELRPGDLLYIPRGFMHEARSNEDLSLHITFGLYPNRTLQVLVNFLETAASEKDAAVLRETFTEANIPKLLEYLRGALTPENLSAADARMEEKFVRERRNGLAGQISEVMRLRSLSEDSYAAVRPDMLYEVQASEKNTKLRFSGKTLFFGPGAAAIVHELEGMSGVQVRSLLKHDPNALSIVRKLIQEGFALQLPAAPAEKVAVA